MNDKALEKVVVHPLVLLSVTDHFTRVGKTGSGRVVGILLGKWTMGGTELDISNSFALPFDEDSKDSNIWFLDHDYLESMFAVSIFNYGFDQIIKMKVFSVNYRRFMSIKK